VLNLTDSKGRLHQSTIDVQVGGKSSPDVGAGLSVLAFALAAGLFVLARRRRDA
jgi:hypothetical protein